MASRASNSWAWDYFYKDGTKHGKNGGSGQNAWCVGCLDNAIQQRRSQAEAGACDNNETKTYEQYRSEVIEQQVVKSRKGKPQDSLIPHLRACKYIPLAVRIKAGSNEQAQTESNENDDPNGSNNPSAKNRTASSKAYVAVTPGPYSYKVHTLGHTRTRSRSLPPTLSKPTIIPPLQDRVSNSITHTGTDDRNLNEDERAAKRVKVEAWTPQLRSEFNHDFTAMMLASGVSWSFADNPHVRWMYRKWLGVEVPCRKTVSGPILNRLADNIIQDMKLRLGGKKTMGQSDGWKNIAKISVMASLVTVKDKPYILRTHDVSARPKTGEELLEIIKSDINYAEEVLQLEIIGWCTDDGGDARKMRRLLQEQYKHLIITYCWAHQINLTVGDIIGMKLPIFQCIPKALEVVKWFNSHSRALGILNNEQKTIPELNRKALALILPVITRWTAHYCSLQRLAEVEGAIRSSWSKYNTILLACAGQTRSTKEKAEEIRKIVQDQAFWNQVHQVTALLEPFAIASNIAQASNTRLYHVTLMLGNLFHIFSEAAIEHSLRDGVLSILEKRWAKADQDLFIVAVVMNPYIRDSCFTSEKLELTRTGLFAIVKRVCERVLNRRTNSEFHAAFIDYLNKEGEFDPEFMALNDLKEEAEKKVRKHSEFSAFDWTYNTQNEEPNLIHVWEGIKTSAVGGRNDLVLFAIHILSVIPNSAGSERLFSDMGITHTKLRNLLGLEKVTKSCMVRMDIRRGYEAAGLGPKARKRKLAEFQDASSGGRGTEDREQMSTNEGEASRTDHSTLVSDIQSYETMAAALLEDVRLCDMDETDASTDLTFSSTTSSLPPMGPQTTIQTAPTVRSVVPAFPNSTPQTAPPLPIIPQRAGSTQRRSNSKTSIPLRELFKYPSSGQTWDGIDEYWKGGIRALTEVEILEHEVVTGLVTSGGTGEDGES